MTYARDEAVSSVIGTVLMLAVTVSVFGGFAFVVLSELGGAPDRPRTDLGVASSDQSLVFLHKGGESFAVTGDRLVANLDDIEVTIALTDDGLAPYGKTLADLGLDDGWGLGDRLCVWGQATTCLFDADLHAVSGAFLVSDNALLLDVGERGFTGTPDHDLRVSGVTSTSPTPAVGTPIAWNVEITNEGLHRLAIATALVHFEVDGTLVATASVDGPFPAGSASFAVSTPGWLGSLGMHALRVTVDPTGLVPESDELDNALDTTFEVFAGVPDPGQPFVDANGDGLYTPSIDVLIDPADVQDGAFDAGSGSLVLPDSVGAISASQVSFTAGGDIVVAVDLTSVNAPLTITAGGDLVFDQAQLLALQNNREVTLVVGGDLIAPGLTVEVNGGLVITAGGTIDLSGSWLEVVNPNDDIVLTSATVDLAGAVLRNQGNTGNQITVTATNGAILAAGVDATSTGNQAWKATNGGITLSSSTLSAGGESLSACLASATADGLVLSGTLAFTDADNRLDAQRGASCAQDANADAYVTPWPSLATDSPRSRLA